MSRIGKQPITIPDQVQVKLSNSQVEVSGPQGSQSLSLPPQIKAEINDNQIQLKRLKNDRQTRANHGTTRAHLQNLVNGVLEPFQKQLEIRGTGYKANVNNQTLNLTVGFIHPVELPIPSGLSVTVDKDTLVTVSGIDKNLVGQFSSNIRKVKKPEPYQGKGIRYIDEHIKLKPGKAAKTEA